MGTALADREVSSHQADRHVPESQVPESQVPESQVPEIQVPGSRAAETKARVIAATLSCIARFGLSKTTVDDIARRASISRATIYRIFPGGRDEIVGAAVSSEVARFFDETARGLDGIDSAEDRLVLAMTLAADQLARHSALALVLAQEPELVLPRVSFGELDRILDVTGAFLAPYLTDWLSPEDARRVGEWITRLVLSHVVCPATALDGLGIGHGLGNAAPGGTPVWNGAGPQFAIHPDPLGDARARKLVRQFVLPGIEALMMTARPATPVAPDSNS